jgi:hypothetical protein
MSAAEQIDITPEVASSRRFDPFRVLTPEQRERQMEGYLAHLRQRDGEMDFRGRKLMRREAWVGELEQHRVVWQGPVEIDAFYKHFHKVEKPPLDRRTTWLVAAGIANQLESYGVEVEVAKWMRRGYSPKDEIVLYDLLEEQYHSRLLEEVCQTAGLGCVKQTRPGIMMRLMTALMVYFPDELRYMAISTGEFLGLIVFEMLLENTTRRGTCCSAVPTCRRARSARPARCCRIRRRPSCTPCPSSSRWASTRTS